MKFNIKIGTIDEKIEIKEEQEEYIKKACDAINKKYEKLLIHSGNIDIRLFLFIILLINQNKKLKVFNNFEDNIIKLLKPLSILLKNTENQPLQSQLVYSNMILEISTSSLFDDFESPEQHLNKAEIEKIKKSVIDDEIMFIDNLIKILKKLENYISNK